MSCYLSCSIIGCLDGVCEYYYHGVIYNATLKSNNITFKNTNWTNWTILFETLEIENISIRYDIYDKNPTYPGVSFKFVNVSNDIYIGGGIYFDEIDAEYEMNIGDDEIVVSMYYSYDGFGIDCDDINKSKYMTIYEEQKSILKGHVQIITEILKEIYDVQIISERYERHLKGPVTWK